MSVRDYRGATVEDLDPLPALTISPTTPLSKALDLSYEHSYSFLPVVSSKTKRLLGYLTAEQLEKERESKEQQGKEDSTVKEHYVKFNRSSTGKPFEKITPNTPLEKLEEFFNRGEEFAVITDDTRKFVLGVATKEDLEKFVQHRPTV